MRLKIYEMGISYDGRTYSEGKKIGVQDGFRALYCILRYNAHRAPVPLQFILYTIVGALAALANLLFFMTFFKIGLPVFTAAAGAFTLAALVNYKLGVSLLFRSLVRWGPMSQGALFSFVVLLGAVIDAYLTSSFTALSINPYLAKVSSTVILLFFNFFSRRFLIFPEEKSPSW